MTVTADEKYDAGVDAGDFAAADDPPDPPDTEDPAAPFGWTRDRKTKELRPKVRPGRPNVPPGPDEVTLSEPVTRADDRPPGKPGKDRPPPRDRDVPMPKGGVIAAGVNKLYRRAGRIIRAMDHDIGTALIECATPDPEGDELTVGEAWEALAKTNPRIRRFILSAISGGAWGDLIMAHAPIGIALFMKPWVQRVIGLERLVESLAEPDEDTPEGEGGLPGGMTAADVGQMQDLAAAQARQMAARMGVTLTDEEVAEAMARAQAAGGMPPGLRRRQQPRRMSRAQRMGAPG